MSGETRSFQITLPSDLARVVEDKVASGEYPDESAVMRESLEDWFGQEPVLRDEFLRAEVLPVLEACRADPSLLIPAQEVWNRLEERYRRDMKALGREP